MLNSTITITYGEKVENHVGNQQIGDDIDYGVTCKDIENIKYRLEKDGYDCQIIDLKKGGDMYIMSDKAVGNDWKKRKIMTLRHAAGFNIP